MIGSIIYFSKLVIKVKLHEINLSYIELLYEDGKVYVLFFSAIVSQDQTRKGVYQTHRQSPLSVRICLGKNKELVFY